MEICIPYISKNAPRLGGATYMHTRTHNTTHFLKVFISGV